jgi:hypothetical protein
LTIDVHIVIASVELCTLLEKTSHLRRREFTSIQELRDMKGEIFPLEGNSSSAQGRRGKARLLWNSHLGCERGRWVPVLFCE